MTQEEIRNRIRNGRDFLKFYAEDEFGDFVSDQDQKLPQPPLTKAPMGGKVIPLPREFDQLTMNNDLTEILARRKSSRIYSGQALSLLQLSFLLWSTQGVKEIRGKAYATIRTVPSGGARHGFETYLLVNQAEGLNPGRYHYLPMEHALEYLGPVEEPKKVIDDTL